MLKKFKDLFRRQQFPIQTFSYYIPGPPERKTPYRETHFDREFYSFINKGYEIISINLVPHQSPRQNGMWFIATVRALNEEAGKLNLGDAFNTPQDENFEIEHEIKLEINPNE